MIKIAYLPMGMIIGKTGDHYKNGVVVFKEPRMIQVIGNKEGNVSFNMGNLFGQPQFIEIPGDSMLGDVHDKNVLDAYQRATSSLVVAGEIPANVRPLRGNL